MRAMPWASRLFIMRHPDEDLRRRGQNLITVLWGLLALSVLSIPVSLVNGRLGSLLNSLLVLPLGFWLIWLTHRGHVSVVALIMVVANAASLLLVPVFGSSQFAIIAYYFIINILIAGVAMRPGQIWATLAMNLAVLAVTTALAQRVQEDAPSALVIGLNAGLLLAFATLIAILSTTSNMRALAEARQARAEAQRASQSLAESNAALERQVSERTADLSAALADREAQAQELQAALDAQRRMDSLIADLSLPVIPVSRDALIVPLVGAFDGERSALLLQRVLAQIEGRRAQTLIIDVTGMPIIDTHVSRALLSTAQAARLLGARAILVGIRPEVAQSLVSLGVDLTELRTYATLEQAVETLFGRRQERVWASAR